MMAQPASLTLEWEVTEGLESLARAEIVGRLRVPAARLTHGAGWIRATDAPFAGATSLRLAESAFRVERFDVPRPKALLGDAHFRRLLRAIEEVRSGYDKPPRTFALAAAGSDSSVMLRLRDSLAAATGLADGENEGDLQIRVYRARQSEGWDVLIRLSARPLSARPWRVCSFPGALNATVASAMAQLTLPRPSDRVVNLMSGSGSILIERLGLMAAAEAIGIEVDADRVACAEQNEAAARLAIPIRWIMGDARAVPLPDGSADALCADLPFGQRVGHHQENVTLYPAVLKEAGRLAKQGARFVALTHEIALMDHVLRGHDEWHSVQQIRLNLRGLHPRIYVLQRT